MEAKPDSSSERPLRKRTPLTPERSTELLEVVERAKVEAEAKLHEQQEEALASRYATPVKVLGWLMIGSFVFDLFTEYQDYGPRLVGVVAFFVGLSVLKGSRTALRIAAFMTVVLAAMTLVEIAWTCWHGHPFETGTKWVELGSLPFLAFVVSPCAYLIAESILAICALKLRKVEFWTKPVKISALVVGLLMLVGLAGLARIHFRENEVRRDLAGELAAVRAWVLASGGRPNLDQKDGYLIQALDSRKRIQKVFWKDHPVAFASAYERSRSSSSQANGRPFRYSEWFRLPSGQWGKIELDVSSSEIP